MQHYFAIIGYQDLAIVIQIQWLLDFFVVDIAIIHLNSIFKATYFEQNVLGRLFSILLSLAQMRDSCSQAVFISHFDQKTNLEQLVSESHTETTFEAISKKEELWHHPNKAHRGLETRLLLKDDDSTSKQHVELCWPPTKQKQQVIGLIITCDDKSILP